MDAEITMKAINIFKEQIKLLFINSDFIRFYKSKKNCTMCGFGGGLGVNAKIQICENK